MSQIELSGLDTLRVERVLDAPVGTVWQWLVEPALRGQWFAGGGLVRADQEMELIFDHDELSTDLVPYPARYAQWQGFSAREQVLCMEAPHLLSFSWQRGEEGAVSIRLTALGPRTRLVLTHEGIRAPDAVVDFGAAWLAHLAVLAGRLDGRAVRDFWAEHERAIAVVSDAHPRLSGADGA